MGPDAATNLLKYTEPVMNHPSMWWCLEERKCPQKNHVVHLFCCAAQCIYAPTGIHHEVLNICKRQRSWGQDQLPKMLAMLLFSRTEVIKNRKLSVPKVLRRTWWGRLSFYAQSKSSAARSPAPGGISRRAEYTRPQYISLIGLQSPQP